MVKEHDLYFRLVNELQKQTPNIDNIYIPNQQQDSDEQFNIFVASHLLKYLQAHQVLQQIKNNLHYAHNKYQQNSPYYQLPHRIYNITNDGQLQKIFTQLFQAEKRLNQMEKVDRNSQRKVEKVQEQRWKQKKEPEQTTKALQLLQFDLKQLKYLNLVNEESISSKLKKMVEVINVYQSFLILASSQKKSQELEEQERIAHDFYKANSPTANAAQCNQMRKILQTKYQYIAAVQALQEIRRSCPQINIGNQYQLKSNLHTFQRYALTLKKENEETLNYLEQVLTALKQRKEIPSAWYIPDIDCNRPTFNLLKQFKQKIDPLVKEANQSRQKGTRLLYSNPLNYFRMCYQDASYQQLKGFVIRIYKKLTNTEQYASTQQMMRFISQRVEGKGYSSQIIDEVINYQCLLNEVVDKIFEYFHIHKHSSNKHMVMYTFTLQDLVTLKKAIQQSHKCSLIGYNQHFHHEPTINHKDQLQIITKQRNQLNEVIYEITRLFIKLVKSQEREKFIFSSDLPTRIKQFDMLIQQHIARNKDVRYYEEVNSQTLQGYQILQEQKPKQTQGPVLERSLDFLKQLNQNNKSLQQKQTIIKQLTEKCSRFEAEISQLKASYNQINERKDFLITRIQSKEKEIELLRDLKNEQKIKQAMQDVDQRMSILDQQNAKFKQQNEAYHQAKVALAHELQAQKEKYQREIKQLKAKHQEELRNVQTLAQERKKSIIKSQQYQSEIDRLNSQIYALRKDYQNFKENHYIQVQDKLNRSVVQFSRKKSKGQEQVSVNTSFIQQIAKPEYDFDEILRLQNEKQTKYEDQIKELKKKQEISQQKMSQFREEITNLSKEIVIKEKELSQIGQKYKNLQEENNNLQRNIKLRQQDIESLKATIKQLEEIVKTKSQNAASSRQRLIENRQQQSQIATNLSTFVHYTRCLFNQDVFHNDQQQKQKLVKHIQWYTRSKITRTQLLHKYDTRNKVNFHQYIDDLVGLVVVIKTKNAIIAGFYPGALRDKDILNKGGLLISVTNDQSYLLYNKRPGDNKIIYRGMIYDTFFAIFGNAEIRVKSGYKTVFSNFGVSNGYFNNRGDKVEKFLNQGEKREVQFQFCEFYQISFERQSPNYR